MFAKLFNKHSSHSKKGETLIDLNPQVIIHYGIPSTASRLAYDPIQQLLAVGTLDGRIKVIGRDTIEGLMTSPKELPFKNLEFLQNQGFLISISNENEVQVWDLENRCIASTLQWESNITAFSVLQETSYMYMGDECGLISVLKYDIEERKLLLQPFNIPATSVSEAAGISSVDHLSVVGVLPQPCSHGSRVLFAYDNGAIVLWDISKDQLLFVREYNDHLVENRPVDNSVDESNELKYQNLGDEQEDKEIVSLCWASLDGSILAVGYVDGDIMIWNLSGVATIKDQKSRKPANNVVKLQLSSAHKRFPVIVLHWSPGELHNDHGGQLFVYGGDEIGSAEVLTILDFEWSPRREALKNVKRATISLEGSFADMILLKSFSVLENTEAPSLFILSSPGQLHFYDSACMSNLISQQNKSCATPIHYRSAVPTTEPHLTIGSLISVRRNTKSCAFLSAIVSAAELEGTVLSSDMNSRWPLNGGVPYHLPPLEERDIERLYLAGYQDGSARIWDATHPMLAPLFVLGPEVKCITITGANSSVCALDFSSETLNIAVGSDSGMIRLYDLSRNCNETGFHVVSGTKTDVCNLDQGKGSLLSAVFMLSSSPVCTLRYTNLGARLAVGYESGQVAMLNVNLSSVLFLIDTLASPSSPVTSFTPAIRLQAYGLNISIDQAESQGQSVTTKELMFALRSDLHVAVLDSSNGCVICSFPLNHSKESTSISMYILDGNECVTEVSDGKHVQFLSQDDEAEAEPPQPSDHEKRSLNEVDKSTDYMQTSDDLLILLCCMDALQMYSLKSLIQGHADSIHEVKLCKICCWTATFKKDEKESGLILLYQTGFIEIRSLPMLEVLGELSLMSILRWNFKTNMDKTTSCTENGQISLVNGCEFAVMSLLAREHDFRIPHSLPCLHDKALAAAVDLNSSRNQSNIKESPLGILGGIMKGLRASKDSQLTDPMEDEKSIWASLDNIFSRSPLDPSTVSKGSDEAVGLNIEDIDIDGPLHITPIAPKGENVTKDKRTERKELFEGGTSEAKPKQRTVDEIKAKYRKAGDTSSAATSAASAASQARDKLLERKEKLEKISQNSEELRNGAENFASMAKELAKRMENRKWWQL